MTDTRTEKLNGNNGGGGRSPITFLWFAVFLFSAVAVIAATKVYVADADTLGYAVPHQATFYVHAPTGAAAARFGLPTAPDGIAADEWSDFAISDKDGKPDWGTLLAWRPLRHPTTEETSALQRLGAIAVGDRAYVLGSEAVKTSSLYAFASHASLYDDPTMKRALRAMGGIASTQGYVDPSLPAMLLPAGPSADALANIGQLVFAMDADEHLTYAVISPLEQAAAVPSFLGFGMDAEKIGRASHAPVNDADVTVASPTAIIDPLNVLFSKVERTRLKRQTPPSTEYLTAAGDLRQMLNGPVSVSLLMDKDAGGANYVADFPKTAPAKVKKTILTYLSASIPDKKRIYLPDQDVSVELNVNPDKFSFSPLNDGSLPGAEIVKDEENGFSLVVSPDGKDGTFLSSKPEYITAALQAGASKGRGRCLEPGDGSTLRINVPAFGFKSIRVISNGDKLIKACGYRE